MAIIDTFPAECYSDGVNLAEFDLTGLGVMAPFKSSRFVVPPGTLSDEDCHDVVEIWYVARGALTVHLDDKLYELDEGNAIFFAPGRVHRAENRGTNEANVISVWWSQSRPDEQSEGGHGG